MTGFRPGPVSSARVHHGLNRMPKYSGKRREINAKTQRCKDARISVAKTNPQGWQRVAGGRSGQRGNDHRRSALDGRAPRRGVPESKRPDRSNHLTTARPFTPGHLARRVWHPRRGAGHLLRRCAEVAAPRNPRRPPATLWQPSGLTDPECPNSSPSTCPRFCNRAERIVGCTNRPIRAGNMTIP